MAELDRWHAIQLGRPDLDNPFLAPGFTVAVGRVRPEARVAIIEDAGKIVGFFPFERRSFGLVLPIGAGLSDCQAISLEPGTQIDVHAMLAQAGIASWHFDHLIGTQRTMVSPDATEVASPVIDLSAGFAAYLADGSHAFRSLFKSERKLAREVGPVRFGFGAVDEEALNTLMAWKSEQYRRTGRFDRFADPATVALIRDLASTSEPGLHGTLMTLRAGERLVAIEFSLRSETAMAGWFPAYDRQLGRYSPGMIHMLRTIEAACAVGLVRYDLGKGDEGYKREFKTGALTVCDGWAVRHTPIGYARRAMSKPREIAFQVVLGHPPLRHAARATLNCIGSVHQTLSRRPRASAVPVDAELATPGRAMAASCINCD